MRLELAALAAALLVLTPGFLTPGVAAELPADERGLPASKECVQAHEGLPSCDVGGVRGVLAPNGVCVRMSGHISGEFTGRQLR